MMFYNAKQKDRYINEIEDNHPSAFIENIKSAFNKTYPFENKLGKDCCNFSAYEIQNMYSQLGYNNRYTFATFHSYLKSYTSWCEENFLIDDGVNHFLEYSISGLDKFVDKKYGKKKYLTREDLEKMVQLVINPRDKFIILCLFEFGKSAAYQEILNLKMSDLDEKTLTAKLFTGRTVKISKLLYNIAAEADKEMIMYPTNGVEVQRVMRYKHRLEYIVKFYMSDASRNSTKAIAKIVKDNVNSMGAYSGISSNTIVVSGMINMIKKRSEELGISDEEYVRLHFNEIADQYGDVNNTNNIFYKRIKDYL